MRLILGASASCLLLVVGGCTAAPGSLPAAGSSPSPTGAATAADGSAWSGRSAGRFGLLRLPADAQVVCTRDAVTWRLPPQHQTAAGVPPATTFWRLDLRTRRVARDDWLTGLLGTRRVDTWFLSGPRVAWLDTTQRQARSDGTVAVAARLETAARPSPIVRTLTGPTWGSLDDEGTDGSTALSAFDGRLCWLQDAGHQIGATGALPPTRAASQWLVDLGGRRALLPAGAYVLALTGDRACWAFGLWRATDFGSRVVHWSELSSDGLRSRAFRSPALASSPAAAERGAFAFTAVPRDATDLADGRVWVCHLHTHAFRALTPGGQRVAAIGDGFVVYVDHRGWTSSHPREQLWAVDLTGSERPFLITSPGTEIDEADVAMIGDEVFWMVTGNRFTLVYGARLVRQAGGAIARPL